MRLIEVLLLLGLGYMVYLFFGKDPVYNFNLPSGEFTAPLGIVPYVPGSSAGSILIPGFDKLLG